nr:hypothetical protein [Tanacetum cinerariifolium]
MAFSSSSSSSDNKTNDKHGLGYFSSESNSESLSPSSPSDRLQPSGGYDVVPSSITGTFMPPKPDLVFHIAPIAVETDHSAFTVQLSPSKPAQDLSHTTRPLAPIIEDWVSDSDDESETNDQTDPQSVPSFVQSSEVTVAQAPVLSVAKGGSRTRGYKAEDKAEEAGEGQQEVQEVVEVVTTAKLITEVVTAASTIVSAARTIIPAAEPKVPVATPTAALVRVAVASTRRRKEWLLGIQKRNQLKKLLLKPTPRTKAKDIDWDTTIEHVKQKAKEDKLDYFKRMSYDDIRPIFEAKFNTNIEFLLKSNEKIEEKENRAIKSINETLAQKAAKRRPA